MKKSELRQIIRESIKKLITEQSAGQGSHGLQITNVLEPHPLNYIPGLTNTQICHTPILRLCAYDINNDPISGNQTCRHYVVGPTPWNPPGVPYGTQTQSLTFGCIVNIATGQPFQIGECFNWAGSTNDKVECVVGFSAIKGITLDRTKYGCQECDDGDCIDCNNLTFTGDVPGCLDCPNCPNYAANLPIPATTDDGSCLGCTNSIATNYEPNADIDDGSCIIDPNNIPGCTDPTAQNYDPNATVDDGSCIATIYGCMDPNAINYFAGVQVDDGSCLYEGCADSTALNYDANHFGCNGNPNDTSCCIYPGDPSGSVDPRDPKDPPIEDPTDKPNKEVCCDWCATVVPDVPSIPPPGCEDWNCDFCDSARDPRGENPDDPNLGENFIYRFQKLANIKK